MVLPLPVVAVLVLVQTGALLVGFFGPAGGRVRPAVTALLVATGVALLPLGIGAVALGHAQAGTLMVWSGVLLTAASARLLRARGDGRDDTDDDGPGGGGGGPKRPPEDPPRPTTDWAAFDRAREAWERAGRPSGSPAPTP